MISNHTEREGTNTGDRVADGMILGYKLERGGTEARKWVQNEETLRGLSLVTGWACGLEMAGWSGG